MIATIIQDGKTYQADLSNPLDISLPLTGKEPAASAWYVPPVKLEPVRIGEWVGSVKQGAAVNFFNITFNPHGNGTHTECLGHISKEQESVNEALKRYFFVAEVISVKPEELGTDKVIRTSQISKQLEGKHPEALLLRTLPNGSDKLSRNYSNTNPPYLEASAARWIRDRNIEHLLIDLPSVDREKDDGKLLAHKAFWDLDGKPRKEATITELIYIGNHISDGTYLLNLQVAPFENDASPSRPVLFQLLDHIEV